MDKNTVEVKQLSVHSYIKKAFRWDLKEDTECKSLKCIYILENNEKCFGAEAKNTVSDVYSRTCWGRERVRRFRVSSTWKRRAVKPGRRSTFSSAAPDSTAPPKAPPRSESQVRCVFFFFYGFQSVSKNLCCSSNIWWIVPVCVPGASTPAVRGRPGWSERVRGGERPQTVRSACRLHLLYQGNRFLPNTHRQECNSHSCGSLSQYCSH